MPAVINNDHANGNEIRDRGKYGCSAFVLRFGEYRAGILTAPSPREKVLVKS